MRFICCVQTRIPVNSEEKFHVIDLVPESNTYRFRYEALTAATSYVDRDEHQFETV